MLFRSRRRRIRPFHGKGMDKEKGEAKPLSEFTDEEIMAEAEARKLVEPEDAAMEEDVADMEGDVVDDSLV